MNKSIRRMAVVCMCGFMMISAGCSGGGGKNGRVTIVYSSNIGAQLLQCGCRVPMGGLAKRSTAIKEARAGSGGNYFIVDSGSTLYQYPFLYPPRDYTANLTARTMAETMTRIGIDAMNVSRFDLTAGVDSVLTFDREASGRWLSANLVWRDSGDLVFRPDTLVTRGDFTVGVFGFMDTVTDGVPLFRETDPVTITDPLETVKREVAALNGRCDFIIALAYMDQEKVKEIVSKVPGITVVVVSHTHPISEESDPAAFMPEKVGKTFLVRCPDGGRVMGKLELIVVDGSYDFEVETLAFNLRPDSVRKNEAAPEHSMARNEFVDLDASLMTDREIEAYMEPTLRRIDAYNDSLGISIQ